jgi:endoglucanase
MFHPAILETHMKKTLHILFVGWIVFALGLSSAQANELPRLIESDFEKTAEAGEWPAGWPRNANASWLEEEGNGFLRLEATEPDKTIMLYREIGIPEGAEALELSFRLRVSNLKRGQNSWFDARIMMEWMDGKRAKVSPNPPTANQGRNTDGWVERVIPFNVPAGARTLKFMPSLFRVDTGTFDLDDVVLKVVPKLVGDADPVQARQNLAVAKVQTQQNQAAAAFERSGNLISNGDFKADGSVDGVPEHWPRAGERLLYPEENDNRFMRVKSNPGEVSMVYRRILIPIDTKALELSWRWRVTELRPGAQPWFDARLMMNFQDANNQKLTPGPPAAYTRRSVDEWSERSIQFLVPEGAVALEFMPSLFRVRSGVLDMDDLVLRPVEPEALLARQAAAAAERARLTVPPEEAKKDQWPPELKVVGNRLHDPEGREVWLQGVNIASLDWNPRGENVLKSAQVALEEWKANVIRLPVKDEYWFDEAGGEAYRTLIDNVITYTANRGAYLVLDLHRYRAVRPEYRTFWIDAATRYKNHPAVLFDLINEPHGTTWEVWRNGGFVEERQTKADEDSFLAADEAARARQGFESIGMQPLVDAVRETGARNILVVGALDWAYDLGGILKGYAIDEHENGNGIMYATHVYPWKKGWQSKFLDVAAVHPILVGEVGADANKMNWMPAENQEDASTWAPDMMALMQKHRLNYTAWCFHPSASPRMLLDWNYTPTPFWGQIVKDALSGKAFELQRPYR